LKYLRAHNKDVSYIEADVPRWNWVKHRDSSNTVITIRPLDRVYRHNSGSTEKLVRAPGTAGDEDELFNVNIDNNTLIIGGCSLITKQRRKCAHKNCGARLFRRNHEGNKVKKATFRCAKCRLSEYCSEYCRKSDKFHKRICTKIPEPLAGCHWRRRSHLLCEITSWNNTSDKCSHGSRSFEWGDIRGAGSTYYFGASLMVGKGMRISREHNTC